MKSINAETCTYAYCGPHSFCLNFIFLHIIGCFVTLFQVIAVDLVGKQNVSEAVGLSLAVASLGSLLGPPVLGKI